MASITKKVFNLRGFSQEVYNLLKINPTTKYIIEKTGKDKCYVGVYLKRLIDKGYIERLSNGLYKVKQNKDSTSISLTNNDQKEVTKKHDYFRLHNLECHIRLSNDSHHKIKNIIFSDNKNYNVRERGNNNGYYFDLFVTGVITNNNIFLKFPANFEVLGDSIAEVYGKLDYIMSDLLKKWGNVFKLILWKSGRVNYSITNQHLEMVNNGIAQTLKDDSVQNKIKVYDDYDKKTALEFDLSRGIPNLESPHSEKAPDYINQARMFMDRLKRGEVEQTFEDIVDIKTILRQNHLIMSKLFSKPEYPENKEKLIKADYIG